MQKIGIDFTIKVVYYITELILDTDIDDCEVWMIHMRLSPLVSGDTSKYACTVGQGIIIDWVLMIKIKIHIPSNRD